MEKEIMLSEIKAIREKEAKLAAERRVLEQQYVQAYREFILGDKVVMEAHGVKIFGKVHSASFDQDKILYWVKPWKKDFSRAIMYRAYVLSDHAKSIEKVS